MLLYGTEKPYKTVNTPNNMQTILLRLSIPVSVICTSFVCYIGIFFIAPYLLRAVIRIALLIVPIISAFYYFNGKKISIIMIFTAGLLALYPNDKCYNAFNYPWIEMTGASPLTYLLTIFVIIFAVTAFNSRYINQKLILVYLLCAGALFISDGHRLQFLW